MTSWLLDTNIIIYLLSKDPRYAARLEALLQRAAAEDHTLLLTPPVVAEVLYVLEGDYFRKSKEEAADLLILFLRMPGVACEDYDCVLAALIYHKIEHLDFVDGYLAARATNPAYALVSNDNNIGRHTSAQLVAW